MNPIPKQKPFRSKKAIEWFRTQPCMVCGITGEGKVTGHHEPLEGHGMSSKGPDDEQVPLCFGHHRLRHDLGKESFYNLVIIKWTMCVIYNKKQVHKYLEMNNNGREK